MSWMRWKADVQFPDIFLVEPLKAWNPTDLVESGDELFVIHQNMNTSPILELIYFKDLYIEHSLMLKDLQMFMCFFSTFSGVFMKQSIRSFIFSCLHKKSQASKTGFLFFFFASAFSVEWSPLAPLRTWMCECQTKLPCVVFEVNRLNRSLIACVHVFHEQTLLWEATCHQGTLVHVTNGPLLLWLWSSLVLCWFFARELQSCLGTFWWKALGIVHFSSLKADLHHF